jgi:Phytanoyl-CoA dioxygenase (PhyH)
MEEENVDHVNDDNSILVSQSREILKFLSTLTINIPLTIEEWKESFHREGFVVLPCRLSRCQVDSLNFELEQILRGTYDRGIPPDKQPRLIKTKLTSHPQLSNAETSGAVAAAPLGFSGNYQNVKVLQLINVHKSNSAFHAVATLSSIGSWVGRLTGWKSGVRLVQDQVWAKPPGAPPLAYHRDSPYFMFDPPDVVTVWIALDDMTMDIGPLEYVRGSHLWNDDGRCTGTARQFFQDRGGTGLLKLAAMQAGVLHESLCTTSMAGLPAGGMSLHDGRTWHGSAANTSSTKPRRGLGLHFVPANIVFTNEARHSRIWKSYVDGVDDPSQVPISDKDFPIVWQGGCE